MASRREALESKGIAPQMPNIEWGEYLLAHFWQVGPTMGDDAITNTELRNYQENEGITLSPWECKTLRRLSIEYLNESHRATKRDCEPPFKESTDAERLRRAEKQHRLSAFLHG